MIDILLLPFMCLSFATPKVASAEETNDGTFKFNNIVSSTGNKSFMDDDYKKTYTEKKGTLPCYQSYDAYLHHGGEDEIVSDCQGAFTAYEDYKDIKPLALLEG